MSQVYRRPLAAFYLPYPPKDFPLLKDFRTVEGKPPQYSPPLVVFHETNPGKTDMAQRTFKKIKGMNN